MNVIGLQESVSSDGIDEERRSEPGVSRAADAAAAHAAVGLVPAETRAADIEVSPSAAEHRQTLRPHYDGLFGHHRGPVGHDRHRPSHQRHETQARARRTRSGSSKFTRRLARKTHHHHPTPLSLIISFAFVQCFFFFNILFTIF